MRYMARLNSGYGDIVPGVVVEAVVTVVVMTVEVAVVMVVAPFVAVDAPPFIDVEAPLVVAPVAWVGRLRVTRVEVDVGRTRVAAELAGVKRVIVGLTEVAVDANVDAEP